MRWNFHRIEIIRQYYVPGNTAYMKAFRDMFFCLSCEKTRNGVLKKKGPRLPREFYRADYSMRVERPIIHIFVRLAAFSCFFGNTPGVGPLRANLLHLYESVWKGFNL